MIETTSHVNGPHIVVTQDRKRDMRLALAQRDGWTTEKSNERDGECWHLNGNAHWRMHRVLQRPRSGGSLPPQNSG